MNFETILEQIETSETQIQSNLAETQNLYHRSIWENFNWDAIANDKIEDFQIGSFIHDLYYHREEDLSYSIGCLIGHRVKHMKHYPHNVKERFLDILKMKLDALSILSLTTDGFSTLFGAKVQAVKDRLKVLMTTSVEELENEYLFISPKEENSWLLKNIDVLLLVAEDFIWHGRMVRKLEMYEKLLRCVHIFNRNSFVFYPLGMDYIHDMFEVHEVEIAKEISISWYNKRAHLFPFADWIKRFDEPENFFYLLSSSEIENIKTYKISEVNNDYHEILSDVGKGSSEIALHDLQVLKEKIIRYQSW